MSKLETIADTGTTPNWQHPFDEQSKPTSKRSKPKVECPVLGSSECPDWGNGNSRNLTHRMTVMGRTHRELFQPSWAMSDMFDQEVDQNPHLYRNHVAFGVNQPKVRLVSDLMIRENLNEFAFCNLFIDEPEGVD